MFLSPKFLVISNSFFLIVLLFQVLQFISRQQHSKKYILVHCTHGHNRTGYMIVHYLMRTRLISVTEVSYAGIY